MKTIRSFSTLAVAAAALTMLFADVANAQSEARRRIEREIREKQEQMRSGKAVVRANVRVMVRLNNGSRLRGVVKDGRFIEEPDRVAFVATDVKNPSSGLRLWYSNNTNSYIFLPYHSIKRYRIGEKLTDSEVEAIAQRIDASRREAEKRRKEQLAKRAPAETDEAATAAGGDSAAAKPAAPVIEQAPSRLTSNQLALLREFPPKQGWGLDKLQTLERRKVTIGVFPTKNEAKFIENFAAWNEAHEIQVAEEEAARAAEQARKDAPQSAAGATVPTEKLPSSRPSIPTPKKPSTGTSGASSPSSGRRGYGG